MKLACGEEVRDIRIEGGAAVVEDRRLSFSASGAGERIGTLKVGEESVPVRIVRDRDSVFVWCAGEVFEFRKAGVRTARPGDSHGGLAAPMPGRVRRVIVSEGARVARGDVILILEAMKMEHAIRATKEGTVGKIFHREGDLVDAGAPLAEIH